MHPDPAGDLQQDGVNPLLVGAGLADELRGVVGHLPDHDQEEGDDQRHRRDRRRAPGEAGDVRPLRMRQPGDH